MTGADIKPLAEASAKPSEWFNTKTLIPNQYVWFQATTPAGLFVHAFMPSQLIAQGTEAWSQLKQRLDLYCMIGLLPPGQVSLLTQTTCQFFVATEEGRQIAASHNYLPCFAETILYPLPASVIGAFDDLSTSAMPPYPEALQLAKAWMENLYGEIKTQEKIWIVPHITVQDGGDVVFEWWHERKSLRVFVSVDEVWFLQSAGSKSEQSEGDAGTAEVRHGIWQWLTR